jgi:hypothetical protein
MMICSTSNEIDIIDLLIFFVNETNQELCCYIWKVIVVVCIGA